MNSLSVEDFAVVLAHLEHFGASQSANVLGQLKVPERALLDAANTIPLTMADQLSKGESIVAAQFQDAFQTSTNRLAETKPHVQQLTPLGAPRTALARPADPMVDATLDPMSGLPPSRATPFRAGPAMQLAPTAPRMLGEGGETIGLEAQPADALPFGSQVFSTWSVETYANYTAERRWLDTDAVRQQYGLRDGADEHALMVHFNRRLASEPGMRERWTELVQRRARELSRG